MIVKPTDIFSYESFATNLHSFLKKHRHQSCRLTISNSNFQCRADVNIELNKLQLLTDSIRLKVDDSKDNRYVHVIE